ncbi:MAG: sensor histidine kinase [Bacteroidia bacterium]|nr:sensor histidine kinase [Bacteroidia bacterium]
MDACDIIYKRISNDNSIILNQKISLETSLAEKETLLKEVHHRVKNNFQIITGLLEKQASKTSDPKAKSLFREGQDRIISMALVHQNIYQSSNLNSIGLKNYIELLSLQIRQSFNHKTGIDIETEIDPIEVNIDKAIPIGLILNECITNCFKHAFPNQINGKIQIILIQTPSGFQLEINDNGIGLNSIDQSPPKTNIGIDLLKGLSRQLDARFEFGNLPQQGSFFRFFIKN